MRQRTTWLDKRERDLIVDQALALLWKVGIRAKGSRRLAELGEAGAQVDEASGVVRFPEAMVREAITRSPRSFLMAGADEAHDAFLVPGAGTRFCSSGCVAFTLDHRTGERRPSTLRDLREATIVLDELPQVDQVWTIAAATDLPPEGRELIEYGTVLLHTRKHVTFVESPREAAPLRRLAEALAGDLGAFSARPRFSTLITVASPLGMDGALLDVHAAVAAFGTPVEIYSVPMTGATSPITLAGTITQAMAEFLGALCFLQTLAPGARLIMGSSASVLDMRSQTLSYAAPESALMCAACTEVAHSLDLPVIAAGVATDAKHPGVQAAYEKALKGLTLSAAEADIQSGGVGTLEAAALLSLPQAVIDDEIAASVRRILAEVPIDAQSIQAETIERVGIGGSFLAEAGTRRQTRGFFRPAIASRLPYEAWRASGTDELQLATARVEEILARRSEVPGVLDEDVGRRVRAVCGIT